VEKSVSRIIFVDTLFFVAIANQRDQCDWRFANVGRQCSEIIQSPLRWRIEDVILPERVDATGLVRESLTIQEVDDVDVGLPASHDRQVVVQGDRSLVLNDDCRRSADLGEPLPDEVRVADRRREGNEAHRGGREDDLWSVRSKAYVVKSAIP